METSAEVRAAVRSKRKSLGENYVPVCPVKCGPSQRFWVASRTLGSVLLSSIPTCTLLTGPSNTASYSVPVTGAVRSRILGRVGPVHQHGGWSLAGSMPADLRPVPRNNHMENLSQPPPPKSGNCSGIPQVTAVDGQLGTHRYAGRLGSVICELVCEWRRCNFRPDHPPSFGQPPDLLN